MREALRAFLIRVMRVPPEPAPPPGDPSVVRTFRAAPSYFGYRLAVWTLSQLSALVGLVVGLLWFRGMREIPLPWVNGIGGIGTFELLAWAGFLVQLPFSFLLLRLDFEMRWYILSDRSLRIRDGILTVHEKTMTFANIQQITIRQNPLQRIFGIATVAVRAAGGGGAAGPKRSSHEGAGGDAHEALFEGVANAELIRDTIRQRVRAQQEGTGLGDPDEQLAIPSGAAGQLAITRGPGASADAVAAAHRLLEEVKALRTAVTS